MGWSACHLIIGRYCASDVQRRLQICRLRLGALTNEQDLYVLCERPSAVACCMTMCNLGVNAKRGTVVKTSHAFFTSRSLKLCRGAAMEGLSIQKGDRDSPQHAQSLLCM